MVQVTEKNFTGSDILRQGSEFGHIFNLKLDDGSDWNSTGWEARGQVRDASDNLIADFVVQWVNRATGKLQISLYAPVTAAIEPSADGYFYDVELYLPNDVNRVIRVVEGKMGFTKERTLA